MNSSKKSFNKTPHYDLVIAGAGIVGATLANALANSNLHIAIIEAQKIQTTTWPDNSVDLRVSAINRASQHIFEQLEVWPAIEKYGVNPFHNMFVWESKDTGEISFDCAEIGAAHLGHIIENRNIQAALINRLQQYKHIDFYCPAHIASLQYHPAHLALRLDNGKDLNTRLLIGADGSRSSVRRLAHIQTRNWSYQQHAVVTVVHTENAHQQTAWQHFLPTGPVAFLPLADGRSSIIWSTEPQLAQELLNCNEKDFQQQLGAAFDFRLGAITAIEKRLSFPLHQQHATHYIKPRIALIGDAAHTIHPLAGQGVNLGLLDAAALADVILTCHPHEDFASQRALRRYERWRKGDNLLTMGIMDGFKRLFSNNNEPLRWLRNQGMNLTDKLPLLKQALIYHAIGNKSDLPPMAKPFI